MAMPMANLFFFFFLRRVVTRVVQHKGLKGKKIFCLTVAPWVRHPGKARVVWDLPWSEDHAHPLKTSPLPLPLMEDQSDLIEAKSS